MVNKNLSLLLAGQFVSQIGDKFHMIALAFWVLKTTGSSAKMGAVLAASLIPSLVLGLFSGAFIDRYNRKYIIVGTDLFRGVIIALFAVLFYFKMMNFYLVLVMQVLLSMNAAFFDPAIPSVVPQIVDENDLTSANSKHQLVNGVSTIAGAFLGGIFMSMFGVLWVLIVNAGSFIISAVFECFIQIKNIREPSKKGKSGIFSDLKKGYDYIFSKRVLMILIFMVLLIHFFVGSIEVFMPVIAESVSENGAKTLGFFHAFFGMGSILMAVVFSIKEISGKEKPVLFGSVFLIGLLFAAGSFFNGSEPVRVMLFSGMVFFFGCCIITASVSFKTLLQKSIDNQFAGRVFSVAGSVGNASIPGAMILYGILLETYNFQGLLLVSGLILMPLSLLSFMLYKEKNYDQTTEAISKSVS